MDKSPYRDEAEEIEGRKKDSVKFARDRLLAENLASEADLEEIDRQIEGEMDAALEFAVAAQTPSLASMFEDVYAAGEPKPEPVRSRIDRILARN
jgi:pyruvate dehydrogenase E1 component alpha subunit